ncbi:ParB N-terminal domain-containing protein [Pseudonocardia sp. Ae717_Ps2]|uniref:ParB N-terminal domain-containing protein n=1 Tax=Pseudonocardia sp. Ae717_Ps2 TaxID=1885573 RepID=UPI00350F2BE1
MSDLAHNPRNPRYGYDDSAIEELADSLREHHQLQPATVVAEMSTLLTIPRTRISSGPRRGWSSSETAGSQPPTWPG